jgi:hypothetical protein
MLELMLVDVPVMCLMTVARGYWLAVDGHLVGHASGVRAGAQGPRCGKRQRQQPQRRRNGRSREGSRVPVGDLQGTQKEGLRDNLKR